MRPNTAKQALEKEREEQGKSRIANKSRIEKRAVNITFRTQLSQFKLNSLISQHRHLINQSQWRFNFGEFKNKNVANILTDARVLLILSLQLHFCKQSMILKELAPISFPKLMYISLTGNKITSLQPLQRADLPSLERLFLRENFLTSLRSLRKCNFHLKALQVCDNKLITLDGLQQLDLTSLVELWGYNNPISFNQSLMKLQANYPQIKKIQFQQTLTVSPFRFQRELTARGVQYTRLQ